MEQLEQRALLAVLFEPSVEYDAGIYSFEVESDDFNGDNISDLVVTDDFEDTVSILLGNGDGTFAAPLSQNVGDTSWSVTTGDFNEDGNVDLATNHVSDTMAVMLGNGDGSFATPVSYFVGDSPAVIITDDFNGDNHLDLLVGNQSFSYITMFLGNGDGTFGTATNHPVAGFGSSAYAVTSDDFDGDGNADIAVTKINNTEFSNDHLTVMFGNGDGTFGASMNYGLVNWSQSVESGDINGDGHPDLAASVSSSDMVAILLNNGDGTFAAASYQDVGIWPIYVTLGDVDSNNELDLVVANYDGHTMSVLLNNGDGTFENTEYAVADEPGQAVIDDLNGDNVPDLAITSYLGDGISILLQVTSESLLVSASDEIDDLTEAALLTNGQSNSLQNQLESALSSLQKGNTAAGTVKISATINRIDRIVNQKKTSMETVDALSVLKIELETALELLSLPQE